MSASCRTPNRIRHALVALTMVGIAACAGDQPAGPDTSILAAKGGGGLTVTGADPNNAPQGAILDVSVIGSGFEDGFVVTLLLAGESTPKILTKSTTFHNGNLLVARIEIAVDAEIAFYDIEVAPPRGRPGVGSELFSVNQKGKPGDEVEPQFTITETDLGTLGGSYLHKAWSVVSGPDGNSVRVVGESGDRAFYWTDGTMVELKVPAPTPPGYRSWNSARDINDAGQVVGHRFVDKDDPDLNGQEAVLWNTPGPDAESVDLWFTEPRPVVSEALAINNSGVVVGRSFRHPEHFDNHAMIWRLDKSGNVIEEQDIHGDFAGAITRSVAEDINDHGQVVVRGWDGTQTQVFLWEENEDGEVTVTSLGGGYASAINDAYPVQIVGHVTLNKPVVWTVSSGSIRIDVIPPLPGFDRAQVYEADITDDGKIAGFSVQDGPSRTTIHATLWTINYSEVDGTIDMIDPLDLTPDLSSGENSLAFGIDNSAPAGVVRVVGYVSKVQGRRRTGSPRLWTVVPR